MTQNDQQQSTDSKIASKPSVMDDSTRVCSSCFEADRMPPLVAWLPDQVVCDRCYTAVAELAEPTSHMQAVFKDGAVRHASDGRVLSRVHWLPDKTVKL
jgi:hypothetical protein